MRFYKYQGLGNDYIYIDCFHEKTPEDPPELSRKLSRRCFSVGSDGLILIEKSDIADAKMRIFNADGSEAEMCGNGIRCVGKALWDLKLTDKTDLRIETGSGIKRVRLIFEKNRASGASVDMGKAVISDPITLNACGRDITLYPVDTGNPHAAVFTDDLADGYFEAAGPYLSSHPVFPEGANIEFIKVINNGGISVRVWERGSGPTLACGTGACAAAFASVKVLKLDNSLNVSLPGGDLRITINDDDTIEMNGTATFVYKGETDDEQ